MAYYWLLYVSKVFDVTGILIGTDLHVNWLVVPAGPKTKIIKQRHFVDTIILHVSRDLPFSQIQPLKSADY